MTSNFTSIQHKWFFSLLYPVVFVNIFFQYIYIIIIIRPNTLVSYLVLRSVSLKLRQYGPIPDLIHYNFEILFRVN